MKLRMPTPHLRLSLSPSPAPFRRLHPHPAAAVLKPKSRAYTIPSSSSSSSSPGSSTGTQKEKGEVEEEEELITATFPAPHTGSIVLFMLNRPSARNALSVSLLSRLRQSLDELTTTPTTTTTSSSTPSPVRALVLASNVPRIFCAGADLKERATFTPADTAAFLASLRQTLSHLSSLPIPTIAAISGVALGGGLELALAADLRVVGPRAELGLPETRLGIIPGAGGTYRLPRVVGEARALDIILSGRRVGAIEAVQIGLANRVVDVGGGAGEGQGEGEEREGEGEGRVAVVKAALEVAVEICEGGPVAVRAAKRAVRAQREEAENECYDEVVGTEDRDEALRAFREKRKPVFKGL